MAASISCALFQEFSDALHFITEFEIGKKDRITNYLDDFLFIALMEIECNKMMETFFGICKQIGCPLSMEKSEFASTEMIFLGVLMNGVLHCLSLPEEKRIKAISWLTYMIEKKKATIKEIQTLTGILNFLSRAIVPGRAFTRLMYAKIRTTNTDGRKLKQYHLVHLDTEFHDDCAVWLESLKVEDPGKCYADLSLTKTCS